MSRSRKKSPFIGWCGGSEKLDKRAYNRRFRHISRMALNANPWCEVLPHLYEYSDPWTMNKDGKKRFDPKKHAKWMRK